MSKVSKKPASNEASPVITSTIEIEGHVNPFLEFFSKAEEIVAVGYAKLPNSNTYSSYKLFLSEGKIIKVECDEPNLRAIAEESAKISFINSFTDNESV